MAWKKITSIVLLLCMLLSMFAIPGVGAASVDKAETGAQVNLAGVGANVSNGTIIYFDATNVSESGAVIQFMIGHGSWSQGYKMTKVSNSNLYYVSMPLWEGATEYAIFGCNEEWGGEDSSVTHRKGYAPWSTSVMSATNLSDTVILTANSSGTLSKSGASLNTTHTATACYQSAGGGSYSAGTTGGTVSVSGYNVSGTTGTAKSSSTSGTGISAGIGTSVTMKATAKDGYTFKGWFTSTSATNAESTSATYTYTNTGSAKTLYAKFQLNGPYTISVKSNNTNYGTVSPSSTSLYFGKTATLTATPKPGYYLKSWGITGTGNTLSSTTATSTTVTAKAAGTATATFAAVSKTFNVKAGTGGSISGTNGSVTYSSTKTFSASANTGYYFTGWTVSGGTAGTDFKYTSGSASSSSITVQPLTNGGTVTFTANFSSQYKVTTQQNWGVLGTVTSTTYVTPGNTVTLTATADSGNGFKNWTFPSGTFSYTSGNANSTSITIKPSSNVTAQANFYAGLTVSAGTGGTVSPSGKNLYDYNKSVTITATPNAGYHFTGWTFGGTYSGSPSTSSASTTITVQDQTTAKANFAINTYTVTFKNWDGTVLATRTGINHGSAATAPSNPTRPATAQYSYTFSGWDKSFSNVTGDLIVTALFTQTTNKYTVTFKSWDGSTISTQSVAYGSGATAPAAPSRAGWEFTGWDKEFNNITGNLTVTAQYKDVRYYLMGDMNSWGGTVMSETNGIASVTVHLEPGTYKFKLSKDGTWWGNNGTIVDTTQNTSSIGWEMKTSDGDCTLSAFGGDYTFKFNTSTKFLEVIYNPDRFTVTFFNEDGSVIKSNVVMKGASATAPAAPTKQGDAQYSYTFSGWDKSFTNVQSTLDIYPVFTQTTNKYTVTFKNWDGTVLSTQQVEYGKNASYTGATPTKTSTAQYSYTFSGWDKSLNNITGNLTVTAQFTSSVRSYTVTFVNWDGTKLKEQSVEYGKGATAPTTAPTRPATAQYTYTFAGWDKPFNNITGTLTVTATYSSTVNKYTVTFVNWDGTKLKEQSVAYGSGATAPSTPTRPADAQYTYTFSGWDKPFNNITGSLTVTAQYSTTLNKYTVTFVNYDGTELKTQLVEYGKSATAPTATPTKPSTAQYSYTFSGWDKNFSKITGNLTVTAQFTQVTNKYTVTFKNFDGTVLSTQQVEYGKGATAPSTPTRPADAQYTYTFTGWDKPFNNITGNLTVTAQYGTTTNKYTVTFKDHDGTVLSTQSVAYGASAPAPQNPTRKGYEFTGWDKDFSNITGNLTVTAQYRDVQMYLLGDFNAWASSTPMTEKSGNIVTISVTLDAGTYGFKLMKGDTGIWYGNAGTIEDTTLATSDIGWEMFDWEGSNCTLAAKGGTYTFNFNTETHFLEVLYAPYTYIVTFVNFDGTVLKTETVDIGKDATAPQNPTRPATAQYTYTFKGWDKEFTNITANTTVTATYNQTVNKYTVTFKDWDGRVLSTQSIAYGSSATAPANPTRSGYEFTGWGADFSNITGNLTVTAQYVDAAVYLLGSFNNWAKDTVMATKSGNIVTATLDLEAGTYTFKILHKEVWYGNYGTIADTTTTTSAVGWEMVDGANDCTLTATGGMYVFNYNTETHMLEVLYVPEAFKVTFKNFDGTVLKTEAVIKGQSATAPATPGRPADAQYTYTFKGWDTDFSNIQADTVVTATYTATINKYTVTFKDWDGTVLSAQQVEYGKGATAPQNPTRAADVQYSYSFKEWDKAFSNITGDLTVTATYTKTLNKYTVTFVNWDDSVIITQQVEYGKGAVAPANPVREGDAQYSYTFSSWDKDFSNITGDITVKATYTQTVNKYTVTFVDFDGTQLSTQQVEYGKGATAPAAPSRDDYVFTGWDKEFTNITGDTVVTAQYEEVQVTLLGSFNNWVNDTPMEKVGANSFTTTLALAEGTYKFKLFQNGVWFGNWGTIEDTTTDTSEVGWEMVDGAEDCTLVATGGTYIFNYNSATRMLEILFAPPSYTVTFKDFDGRVLKEEVVVRGLGATAPETPSRDGYVFTGWDKEFTNITADTVITAQYAQDVVYLLGSFNNWEKTTVMTGDGVVSVTLKLDAGTYTFKILNAYKWLGNSGNIEDTTIKTSATGWEMVEGDNDCTLTASGGTYTFNFNKSTGMLEVLFTPPSYTVTFVDFDGTVLKTETVVRGNSATAPEDPTREGYVFIGWNKGFANISSDLVVTAQYAQDTVYLVGSWGDWALDTEMTKTETDGVVSVTLTLSEGTYQFKILNIATWFGNTGTIIDTTVNSSETGWIMVEGNDNCTLKASGGTYTFNYNTITNTLEVLFTPPSYTVTFKDWDGTILKEEVVVRGSSATAPEDPEREGYIFQGWNKDFSYIYTNTVVTATYLQQKVTYTVTFLDWDGTVLSSQIVTTGEAATAPEVPQRENYDFIGWDKDFSNITYNLTVTARYQDNRVYLVGTFTDWTTNTQMTVTEDGDIVSVEVTLPQGTHYFKILYKDNWYTNWGTIEDTTLTTSDIGWEMITDPSAGDCTLVTTGGKYTFNYNKITHFLEVVYTPVEYTVTFEDFDGTVLSTQTIKLGASATAPADPARAGYVFSGWDKDFANITGDTVVTATYVEDTTQYTVTFVDYDGKVLSTQYVSYGKSAVAPAAPTRAGYVFSGWDKSFTNITGDTTITAQYKDNTVYLYGSFNMWAEGVAMTFTESGDIATYELTLPEGRYFFKLLNLDSWYGNMGNIVDTTLTTSDIGWEMMAGADNCSLTASGGKYVFRYNTATKMLEILYTPIEYTVVFYGMDGEVLSTQTVKYGADATAPQAPEVGGYIFSGWDKDLTNIGEDTEINAVYVKDDTKFTVTFVDFDGTVLYTQELEYGESATAPSDPVRIGYIFTGWDKDFANITKNTVVTAQYKDNQLYLVGSWGNWATDTDMSRDGTSDVFTVALNLEAGTYEFKLLQNDIWYTSASTVLDTTTLTSATGIELRTDPALGNIILNATGGLYTFRFNVRTNKLEVLHSTEKFTVTFVDFDGTVLKTQTVNGGGVATAPEDPTRVGDAQYSYIFAGWDKDFSKITADITITATYTQTVNSYTVMFVDTDGTILSTQNVEYGKSASAPDAPMKDGFIFQGWDTEFSYITQDTVVTAKYMAGVASSVTLAGTFNGWNPSANPFLITTNSDKVTLQMKLDEGTYQFKVVDNGNWYGNWGTIADTTITTSAVGWEMDPSAGDCTLIAGGGTYIFTYTISTHMLEVEYVGSEFKVTFVDWDGTILKTEVVEPGGSATAPTGTFTRPDDQGYTYVFSGWDMNFTNVIAPLRVTAVYKATPKMYTVKFVNWNGAVLKTQSVAYGTAATPPANPTRTGYIFTGWDGDIWYITGNTTFKAQYADNGVYIMGDFNDWQGTKLTLVSGTTYQGSIYLAAGQYKFKVKQGDSWYGNNGWIDDTTTYTSDVGWEMSWDAGDCTLNASGSTYTFRFNTATRMLEILYVAPTYTVTFKNWNGAVLKTQYVKRGNAAYAPANPTRTGYIFTGWDRDFSWIYENTVVTATFAKNEVSVMGDFNNWEGTGMTSAGGSIYTATINLNAGSYKFKIKHIDTWYGNGGTIENSTIATSAIGWEMVWDQGDCTLNATGGAYTFRFNTETRMLEILFKGPSYTVTFVDWDGSIISTQQVEYGKSATAPKAPEREGYTFSGWSADFSFITGNTTIMAQYGDESVYLRGTFNDWSLNSPMRATDNPKVFTYVFNLTPGEYTFKVFRSDVWYGNDGTIEDTTVSTSPIGWEMVDTAGDCKLIAQGGTYLFRFNIDTRMLEIIRVTDEVTVTFVDWDGTVIETQTVKYGEAAVAPTGLVRPGYAFTGWDKAIDYVTENITVTALYRKTVVLNSTFSDEGIELTNSEGTKYTATVRVEAGTYTFDINFGGVIYSANSTFADATQGITLITDSGKCTFIASGGIYKFIFDTETNTLIVERLSDSTDDEIEPDPDTPVVPDDPSTGDEIDPDNPSTGDEVDPDVPVDPDDPSTGDEIDPDPDTPPSDDEEEPELPEIGEITHTVIFVDKYGNILSEQIVKDGESATAPTPPAISGYNFTGWNKTFDSVLSDLIITAQYKRIITPEVVTTGLLQIDIVSGSGFRIAIDGGAYRPQGLSYFNSKAPIGVSVTVIANVVTGKEFIGWLNAKNGTILSKGYTYTFVSSGNDHIKALYLTDYVGMNAVIFMNDKAANNSGQILDMQYYSPGDNILFPEAPAQVGYDFTGWNMTPAQIQAKLAAGLDVTVLATWEVHKVYYEVVIIGGTVKGNANASGKYLANQKITLTAQTAPAGMKFAYWTINGEIKSYDTVYYLYPFKPTTAEAVFVPVGSEIDYEILIGIDTVDTTTVEANNIFYYSWFVPEKELGVTYVTAGILAVNKNSYTGDNLVIGTTDPSVYNRVPLASHNTASGAYTWTKTGIATGDTWVARAYVQYKKKGSDEIIVIYSDIVEVTK